MEGLNKENNPIIVAAVSENDDDISDLVSYQEISGHLIFDVKIGGNFRRKDRFVADVHNTDTTSFATYSTVVSRDLVRICLTIAALKDIYILDTYI